MTPEVKTEEEIDIEAVKKSCQKIVSLVAKTRNDLADRPASLDEVHALLQAVVSFMGYIAKPRIYAEVEYNKIVARYIQVEDYTAAKATIIAKTSDAYHDYRYIEYVYKFADTEQMLLKKILSSKEKEFYL